MLIAGALSPIASGNGSELGVSSSGNGVGATNFAIGTESGFASPVFVSVVCVVLQDAMEMHVIAAILILNWLCMWVSFFL
jgi:hypothetical protein